MDPTHSLILSNMALALVGLGEKLKAEKKPKEAVEYFEEALFQHPGVNPNLQDPLKLLLSVLRHFAVWLLSVVI